MTELRMIVQTQVGVIEGAWEDIGNTSPEQVQSGMGAALSNGQAVPLITSEGVTIIPAHAVVFVRFEVRNTD